MGPNPHLLGYHAPWVPPLTPSLLARVSYDEYVAFGCLTLKDLSEWFDGPMRGFCEERGCFPVMLLADRILTGRKHGPDEGHVREVMFTRRRPLWEDVCQLTWQEFEAVAKSPRGRQIIYA
jgi:hypothetical protein